MPDDPATPAATFDPSSAIRSDTDAAIRRAPMAEAIGAEHPAPRSEQQDNVCLVFAVEDVDSEYESLVQKGVVPINEPHDRKDWGIRRFHIRDPDGNLIEVNRDFGIGGI